ncbi:hypothetical protein EU546_07670 [Candidatus Thorarchaeota archaeon]|nr:MAG: hypothetical protein EU546_07670 [Candidatus Thorarchaeota archaeon]
MTGSVWGSNTIQRDRGVVREMSGARFRFLRDCRWGESLSYNELVVVDPESGSLCVVAEGPV